MQLKPLLLLCLICFSVSFASYSITVQGVVRLSGLTDHSGISITFIPKSVSAQAQSAITQTDGSYTASVVAGLYDLQFSKAEFQNIVLTDQFITSDVTLQLVTLSNSEIHVSGTVQGNWSNTNTYVVDGNINVPSNAELVIEEGTTIKFSGFYRLQVFGKLTALGSQNQKILFTTTKTSKARGDWAGIDVLTTSDTTRLDYCQVEYASSQSEEKAIIYNTGRLRISNSLIRGAGYAGIFNRQGGYMKIVSTEITDAYMYGIISTSSAIGAVLYDNNIHHITFIGASCQWSVSEFKGNTVANTGYTGIQSYGDYLIERNLLYNNPYGVFVVDGTPTIRNNTITMNNHGIGLYDDDFWQPSCIVISNIIYLNNGYGIYCEGLYKPEKVEYNLINGNPSGVANRGPVGLGQVITTNLYGFAADTYLNIFQSPSFLSIASSDITFLHLQTGSPAIDAGDPTTKDPDNSVADCGAIPIEKAVQTITFNALSDKTVGDLDFTLVASSSSSLPVSFSSSNTNIVSLQGSTVKIIGGGTVTITASQVGDITYRPVSVTRTLVVHKLNQNVTFDALPAHVFGDAQFELSASSSVGLPVSFSSNNTQVATINGSTITIVGAGEAIITATQPGNSIYIAASTPQQLTVSKAEQNISFAAIAAKTFGDTPFPLVGNATSSLNVTLASDNTNVAVVNGNTITIVGAGVAMLTATQLGNVNYNPALAVNRELQVSKASQVITFETIPPKKFGDSKFVLTASSSSSLPLSFSSDNINVALVEGNSVTIIGAGNATIIASQAGNANYNPATNAEREIKVSKADQTITMEPVSDKTLGDAPFPLKGTASSTLPLSYSSTSDKVNITSDQLTLLNSGRVTISAEQQGNGNFNPGTISQSFCIRPTKPVITFLENEQKLLSSNNSGNQWFLNGALIPNAVSQSFEPTLDGTYTVQSTSDDCVSLQSEPFSIIILGVESVSEKIMVYAYPNPAIDQLTIRLNGDPKRFFNFILVNSIGSVVLKDSARHGDDHVVNIEDLTTGIYTLLVLLPHETSTTKIVKR